MTASAKDLLRRAAKDRRNRMTGEDVSALIPNFLASLTPDPGTVVGLYRARAGELDPALLADALREQGCKTALPVMAPQSRILRFALWSRGQTMEPGPFGIEQPLDTAETIWVDPAILVMPLLAFDRQGNRLGYGGGYYDATLHALRQRSDVLAVGIAYAGQELAEALPAEPHDIPLDWIVTPKEARRFTSGL